MGLATSCNMEKAGFSCGLEQVFAVLFFSVNARKRKFPDFCCDSSGWRLHSTMPLVPGRLSHHAKSSEQKTPAGHRTRLLLALKTQPNTSSIFLRRLFFLATSRIPHFTRGIHIPERLSSPLQPLRADHPSPRSHPHPGTSA